MEDVFIILEVIFLSFVQYKKITKRTRGLIFVIKIFYIFNKLFKNVIYKEVHNLSMNKKKMTKESLMNLNKIVFRHLGCLLNHVGALLYVLAHQLI